jgi:hypothetical protein
VIFEIPGFDAFASPRNDRGKKQSLPSLATAGLVFQAQQTLSPLAGRNV